MIKRLIPPLGVIDAIEPWRNSVRFDCRRVSTLVCTLVPCNHPKDLVWAGIGWLDNILLWWMWCRKYILLTFLETRTQVMSFSSSYVERIDSNVPLRNTELFVGTSCDRICHRIQFLSNHMNICSIPFLAYTSHVDRYFFYMDHVFWRELVYIPFLSCTWTDWCKPFSLYIHICHAPSGNGNRSV